MSSESNHERATDPSTRRELLENAALGGAAVAAGLFGLGGVTSAQEAPTSDVFGNIVANQRIRRVVSANDSDGKSFVASDEIVSMDVPLDVLWRGTGEQFMGEVPINEKTIGLQPTGGSVGIFVTFAKSTDPMPNLENRIGFHQTPGISYQIILTGELVFLLDKEEVHVKAGDLVFDRGCMHSWRNEKDTPASLFGVVVSGEVKPG